jgi:HEAT repeat protein
VDPGDRAHAEAARKVASILEMQGKGSEKLVLQAIARLERMRATQEVDALIGALEDSRSKVRKAALGAIVGIGDAKAADGIVGLLPKVRDAAWAMALFSAVPKLDAEALVPLAERVLKAGGELLHPDVRRRGEAMLLVSAIAVLATSGEREHVPALISAALHRDAKVKKAAIDALRARTCQPLTTAKAFEVFWGKEGRKDESEIIARGLEARGIRFAQGARSRDGVGRLISLLDHRDKDVRTCAERLLERMTGHESGASRSPARNRKHWAYWWSENKDASALK